MGNIWEKFKHADAGSNEGRALILVMIMGGTTLLMGIMSLVMVSWIPLAAAMFGWAFVVVYIIMSAGPVGGAGDAIGKITVPTGSSTPSVAQHSNIEAMEARGEYQKAAEAYKAVVESAPLDIVACEKLAQLALRQLKDYQLAIWAYRRAEERYDQPRRKLGCALLIAGIYRDNLKDNGKAIVELRKVLELYPEAPNAGELRKELDELKARHFENA